MSNRIMQVIELLGDILILGYLKAQLFFYLIVGAFLKRR